MLIAMWLVACGGTTSIAARNAPPELVWLAPDPGDTLPEGRQARWRVAVSDADGDADASELRWFLNEAPVCPDARVEDGEAGCEAVVPAGLADVRLEVRDDGGAAAVLRQRFAVAPNARPSIAWRAPAAEDALFGDGPVGLEVVVDDAEDGVDGLVVVWTSDPQGDLGAAAPRLEDGVARLSVPLSEGWHDITAVVTDRVGGASAVSATVHVRPPNVSPSCGWIGPAEGDVWTAGASQQLEAYGTDPEDAGPDLWGRWTSDRDGVLAEGPLDAAGTLIGVGVPLTPGLHVVTWQVDDAEGARCVARRVFEVGSPPWLTGVGPSDGDVVLAGGQVPAFVVVGDAETQATTLAVRWTSDRDGLLAVATPGSDGATAVILPGLTPGWHVVTTTVTDPSGLSTQQAVRVFANQPPSTPRFDEAPMTQVTTEVSLSPRVGDVGVDPEGGAVTLLWSWSLDGSEVATGINFVDASLTESGQRWLVRIVATDGFHQSEAASVIVDVVNHVPSLDDVGVTPIEVRVDEGVVCSAALRDLDGDAWVSFSWYVGDTLVGEGPFYRVGTAGEVRGAPLRCEATARDDAGATAPLSADVEVGNAPPRVLGVTIGAGAPRAGDTLGCEVLGVDDDDGDAVDVTLRWTVNGATAGFGPTFDGNFRAGDVVGCAAFGFDGLDVGPEVGASVVVANAAPQLYDVAVTPAEPAVGEAVTCSYRVVDRDREEPAVYVAWSRDGVPLAQGVRFVVTDREPPGSTLRCEVVAVDPTGATAVATAEASVRNTPPSLTSVTIAPQAPRSDSLLVAVANGGDVNRQPLTWRYVWSVNGVVVADGPGSTLLGLNGAFHRGDLVHVWVEVSDGLASTSASSLEVSIGNALPGPPEAVIEPIDPTPGEAMVCVLRAPAADADGDVLSYVVAWTRDGVAWTPPGAAEDTVPAGTTVAGEVWACAVQADDGEGLGPPATDAVRVSAP